MELLILSFYDEQGIVELERCEGESLVFSKEEQTFQATYFNVRMNEEAYAKACGYLNEAKVIQVEADPQSNLSQPVPLYIFVDGELLQKKLIEQGVSEIAIRNPEYLYEKEMEAAETEVVMARVNEESFADHRQSDYFYIPLLIVISCFLNWVLRKI